MQIYIPTRGRPDKQLFFNSLPDKWKKKVTFVVNSVADLPPGAEDFMVAPKWVTNIGEKRHFIVHEMTHASDKLLMCDDDLRLATRRADDPTKFRAMTPPDFDGLFNAISRMIEEYAHVTVCPREGGNRRTAGNETCTRAMRILGYDIKRARVQQVNFTRCPGREDFDVTLQLLRAGFPNLMLCNWVQDDGGGSNARGGCSIYRDEAWLEKTARDLAAFHPGFVKVVQKTTKGAWGGGTRTDVNIQWKQAYRSSQ